MIDMDDLVTWLRARLDEDERVAREATAGPWRHNPDKHWRKPGTSWFEEAVFAGPPGADATCVAGTGETDNRQSMADAEHIARWDPARVRAEVDAKRRIVTMIADRKTWRSDPPPTFIDLDIESRVLELLALPYADRAGYREEWRP